MKHKIVILLAVCGLLFSCSEDDGVVKDQSYDRSRILKNWADNIIIPSFENYTIKLEDLSQVTSDFEIDPNVSNLSDLQQSFIDAYLAWQEVSSFSIGMAESNNLVNYSNIYPADTSEINIGIIEEDYNLALPSKFSQQGFPALDYLLFGLADDQNAIVERLSDPKHIAYLKACVDRLVLLSNEVLQDWKNGYREAFIADVSSTATSPFNKLVNDFMFHFEFHIRTGKIGIPAGVFSGTANESLVEAPFKADISKQLLERALVSAHKFFRGTYYNGSGQGESMASYLDYLNEIAGNESLSAKINTQFEAAINNLSQLDDNFALQVLNDNSKMLAQFDILQLNVVLLKTEMLQTLCVKVDYVDADGD